MAHIHEKIDFVAVAFIVNTGRVLFVNHRKLQMWVPPGGHIELDEDPEEALFREVKEETGLDITVLGPPKPQVNSPETKFLHTPAHLDIHRFSDSHHHVGVIYFATSKSDQAKLAEQEHHDIRWLSESDLDKPEYGLTEALKFYAKNALEAAA